MPPDVRDLVDGGLELGRDGCHRPRSTHRAIASAAPLRTERPSRSMPLIRVWAENGTSVAPCEVALAEPELLLREHDDRASFRRLVREARELRGVGELAPA